MHMEEVQARGRDAHGTLQALQLHLLGGFAFLISSICKQSGSCPGAKSALPCYYADVDAGWIPHGGVLMKEAHTSSEGSSTLMKRPPSGTRCLTSEWVFVPG
jgi:hypothetical protein